MAYIGTGQIMGWGNKAIEIRSVESGHLDGVFMHKKVRIAGREGKLGFSFSLDQQTWGLHIKRGLSTNKST